MADSWKIGSFSPTKTEAVPLTLHNKRENIQPATRVDMQTVSALCNEYFECPVCCNFHEILIVAFYRGTVGVLVSSYATLADV